MAHSPYRALQINGFAVLSGLMKFLACVTALVAATLSTACVPSTEAAPLRQSAAAPPAKAQLAARPAGEPIVILNDRGGNVLQAISRREQLQRSGRPIEVRGYCRSACTIYISLPNACLGPGATVGFHAPRLPNTTFIPPLVDEIVAPYYRNGIRRMWMSEWRHSLKMVKISAQEFVRLDPQTKLCPR